MLLWLEYVKHGEGYPLFRILSDHLFHYSYQFLRVLKSHIVYGLVHFFLVESSSLYAKKIDYILHATGV